MSDAGRPGLSVLGLGAAACVACCAGPLVAVLGGVSLAGFAATVLIGTAGLVVGGVALVASLAWRRRQAHRACAAAPTRPVAVATPARPSPTEEP